LKHKPPQDRTPRPPNGNVLSMLNSGRNKLAAPASRVKPAQPVQPATPFPIQRFVNQSYGSTTIKAPAPATGAGPPFSHPTHCCVYCGHLVYIPPRALSVRCPMCTHELPVEDVLLSGTVTDPEVVTCGKIVVVENTLVRGNLIACSIDVAGSVCGDIVASYLCTLRPSARHVGRILSRYLNLQEGAEVESHIELIRR
jgi:hypothetical protein